MSEVPAEGQNLKIGSNIIALNTPFSVDILANFIEVQFGPNQVRTGSPKSTWPSNLEPNRTRTLGSVQRFGVRTEVLDRTSAALTVGRTSRMGGCGRRHHHCKTKGYSGEYGLNSNAFVNSVCSLIRTMTTKEWKRSCLCMCIKRDRKRHR
jgi:hypothetical protein